jgi:hypothetical protein
MSKNQTVFFDKAANPIFQAVIVLSLSIAIMTVLFVLKASNLMDVESRTYWIIAGAFILFYGLFNSVISLSATDMNQYWFRSTLSYTVLMVASSTVSYFFSNMTITEAGSFKWIFMVLTFGYLLFLSMMRFMRKIVQIAQQEDNKWMDRMKK